MKQKVCVVTGASSGIGEATAEGLAGLGGSLGKVTSYLLGRSGYGLSKTETRSNLDVVRGLLGR
jgi:NADP-dependent 3-hydroxy acid dehydrogenase YdfG